MKELRMTLASQSATLDLRETQVKEAVADNLQQKQDLLNATTAIYAKIRETSDDLKKNVKQFQGTINLNSQTISDFGLRVSSAESQLAELESLARHHTKCI